MKRLRVLLTSRLALGALLVFGAASVWEFVVKPQYRPEYQQAAIFYERGQYERALLHLQHAYDVAPNAPEVVLLLGWTHLRLTHYEEASYYFQRARKLDFRLAEARDGDRLARLLALQRPRLMPAAVMSDSEPVATNLTPDAPVARRAEILALVVWTLRLPPPRRWNAPPLPQIDIPAVTFIPVTFTVALPTHGFPPPIRADHCATALTEARSLAAAQRFHDALAALARCESPDIALARSRILFWSGRNAAALRALPDSAEAHAFREQILASLQPEVTLRLGWSGEAELPTGARPAAILGATANTTLAFHPHPDLRLELEATGWRGSSSSSLLASLGPTAASSEWLFRAETRPREWLTLRTGAGLGRSSSQSRALYELHAVTLRPRYRLDLAATRRLYPATPLAARQAVAERRESLALGSRREHRANASIEYWQARYSFAPELSTDARGLALQLTRASALSPRFETRSTATAELWGFTAPPASPPGIFTPRLAQRYTTSFATSWRPHPRLRLDSQLTLGAQRVALFTPPSPGFGLHSRISAGMSARLPFGDVEFSYAYSYAATPASPGISEGSYRGHGVSLTFRRRF